MLNSVLDNDAEFMAADITDYYLNTPLERPEYMRMSRKQVFDTSKMVKSKVKSKWSHYWSSEVKSEVKVKSKWSQKYSMTSLWLHFDFTTLIVTSIWLHFWLHHFTSAKT